MSACDVLVTVQYTTPFLYIVIYFYIFTYRSRMDDLLFGTTSVGCFPSFKLTQL